MIDDQEALVRLNSKMESLCHTAGVPQEKREQFASAVHASASSYLKEKPATTSAEVREEIRKLVQTAGSAREDPRRIQSVIDKVEALSEEAREWPEQVRFIAPPLMPSVEELRQKDSQTNAIEAILTRYTTGAHREKGRSRGEGKKSRDKLVWTPGGPPGHNGAPEKVHQMLLCSGLAAIYYETTGKKPGGPNSSFASLVGGVLDAIGALDATDANHLVRRFQDVRNENGEEDGI